MWQPAVYFRRRNPRGRTAAHADFGERQNVGRAVVRHALADDLPAGGISGRTQRRPRVKEVIMHPLHDRGKAARCSLVRAVSVALPAYSFELNGSP